MKITENDFQDELIEFNRTLESIISDKLVYVIPNGKKDDEDKQRWDLLPLDVVKDVVKVLTYGAKKYAPDNWKLIDNPYDRYFAAAMRHLSDYRAYGEKLDKDSGLPHLAHAMCCLIFLSWFEKHNKVNTKSVTTIVAI